MYLHIQAHVNVLHGYSIEPMETHAWMWRSNWRAGEMAEGIKMTLDVSI